MVSLADLESINIDAVRQEAISVSIKAYHEDFLTNLLKEVKNRWANMVVPVGPIDTKPDITALGELKEFMEVLEDSQQTLNKILSNKHVGIILRETTDLQKGLARIEDLVGRLAKLQLRFVFFDDLLFSADIKKQMPTEASTFEVAAKLLLGVFKKVEMKNSAMGIWKIPQIEDHIMKVTNYFDQLQTNVEALLDVKRQKFCRLYLLTNEEMLDLLANFYKNMGVFNAYLGKMFDSVASIRIFEDAGEHFINAIVSLNGEAITFPNIHFHSKGSLEDVMDQLLQVMKAKIKELIFKRNDDIIEATKNIKLELFELDKYCRDNILQPSLLAFDFFLQQLVVNSVGKGEDGLLDNVLTLCNNRRLVLPRNREARSKSGRR